ncbi:hypothetical protein Anas_10967 [Armadillidium nasatum]|uniref:Uncharacterized protein n=1 Tax=Armadillidium nasatum TaxID=96803 RepID=A0A5N5TF81_9CRUS|nr:hypothetical protein Anas_10967 [Armadillidium nasatum]
MNLLILDFNLEEEFINEVPKNKNVIGEITALVKKSQIFLQESAYDMKNMHDCFEKMKKRHAENTRITYRVLQLLNTFNVSPASIDYDTYANLQLENIDNERPPDNTSMDHVYHKLQSGDIEIMEFSQLEKDSNYTTKEGVDEIPNSVQKESEYNSLPNRNQDAKHSSSDETQSFQLEDDDESEILYVDVLSVDSKTDDCTNKTSNNAESSNPQGNKYYKRELLTCDVCKKKIHGLFPDEIKQICREKKQQKPLKAKIGLRCPFPQCSKVSSYVRLDKHLLHFHKLKMSHPLYRQFIKTNTLPNKISKSVAAESGKSTDTGRTPEQDISTEIEYSTIASEQFFDFLISVNGGSVKMQNANHYRTKIRQILEGSDIKKIEEFESQEVVLKLCNWFDSYLETHKKSSANSYMSVLIKFLYYLGIKNPWKNYKYNSLIEDVKDRMHSVSTRNISEKMPVHDITPLEIRAFEISDIGRKCKSNLEMVKSGLITTVSSMEHCQIRNYLVLSAILRNGWKSCALSNMTLEELKEPKKELRNRTMHYNIFIKNHKSIKEPGPMRVTLGEELYNHYLCYVEKIRPLVIPVDSNIQTVFITLNGYSINTDDMCDGILAMWKEAGLKTYITTTVLRNLMTNRINSREDGKINENLAQQSKNSYKNIELSQSVAPSDMYRMLSDENISNIVTMRREVGRERLCKNCPICPKKIKVNSNCSAAKYLFSIKQKY